MQGIIIIAIQAAIASQNTSQGNSLPSESQSSGLFGTNSSSNNAQLYDDIDSARDRLDRIKWENVAFIGFQIWFVGMAFDAVSGDGSSKKQIKFVF